MESQNKLLKYSYLPRQNNITISRLATVLYEDFNPDIHHKYLFLNYKTSSFYRTYNDFVPRYLHGRPRQVILHCLERKSSCRKYDESNIISHDTVNGVFTIKGSSSKLITINFGTTKIGSLLVHALTGYSGNYHANIFLLCLSFLISGDGTAYLNNTSVNLTFLLT